MSATTRKLDDEAEAVAAFLRAHPHFLAERPDLYRALIPPVRVHGETLADHMAAMIQAERAQSAVLAERADGVLAAGRAAAGMAARVQEAVLRLIASSDPIDCITAEMPSLLALDAVALCTEFPLHGAHRLPRGAVSALMGSRDVLFRDAPTDMAMLYGEAAALAQRDALVRVPADSGAALLALASRGGASLDRSQGAGALSFLGRAAAVALERLG
ncbi:MAG TPA: DUF484 family protein [Acidisphaera sp.]|nr:DUF484 family protein [Acidisphaera sp.]